MSWFTEIEDVAYTFIEYIPLVGTVYSLKRTGIAYSERDWKRHWQSLANFGESAVRDVLLITGTAEPAQVALVHTMAELLTDKLVDHFTSESQPRISIRTPLNKQLGHVIVAGKTQQTSAQAADKLFRADGRAKGLHHFHESVFRGTLVHDIYAPKGEAFTLSLPEGLVDNARCWFIWRWTTDASGVANRPERTFARIKLQPGRPTKFTLQNVKGYYTFEGTVKSVREIALVSKTAASGIKSFSVTRRT